MFIRTSWQTKKVKSPMTITASDANELLCDNNTVKTHHVNRSDFFKENLAFQTRSLVKSNSFYLQQSL